MPEADELGGALVTFAVKTNGNPIPETLSVLTIRVEKHVNRIPTATVTILDGSPDTGTFDASSSATFLPGTPITIEAGYDLTNKQIFKGIITRQSLRFNESQGSVLEVECRDESIKMAVGRKSLSYDQKKDSDIITSIIGTYSGLSSSVTGTDTAWPGQVQYYATDWDFILARAEANGLIVIPNDGKVTVAAPDASTSPVLTANYGDDILAFNADLDAVSQLGTVKAEAWDFKTQAVISGTSTASIAGPGNLTSKKLSEVVGLSDYIMQSAGPVQNADLTGWCKAQLVKSQYAKIRGELKIYGSSLVLPATYITLEGLGDRFNGDHFVSGVVHEIHDGNWFSHINIGMSPVWFTEEPDVMAPSTSGLLPGVRGLIQGTVKQIQDDPDGQFRVLVDVPLFDANGKGIWARLSNFYSTANAGAFFYPETGDEVILGFLNEDPRYPIILGSVYSSTKIKPFTGLTPDAKNQFKAIVSKSGIFMKFDDTDKILTINTPGNNTMVWSDKDKQISIKDENGNSIVMSQSGITMKSPKTINIEADQQVNIKGTQGINLTSSGGDIKLKGMNINENADMQYVAKGGMTAEVSSGTQLTIKSAMVMIN